MKTPARVILVMGVIVIDMAVFFVPLCAVFLGYVILARPLWFRNWVLKIYED